MAENKKYTTPNIYLAACLMTAGMRMVGKPDRSDPKRVRFTLEGDGIDEVYSKYIEGTLTGNLKQLCEHLKTIKMELWSDG